MKIKNHSYRYLIIINLIVATIIYSDYLIPSFKTENEKIKSFYNTVKEVPGFKSRSSKEIKYILQCESGNIYYLGKFPTDFENFEEGTEIEVIQTILFNKTKELHIHNITYSISILALNFIIYIFIFNILISVLNVFFDNTLLNIFLALSSFPIHFIGIVYIFYF